jgi:hypothetical protein
VGSIPTGPTITKYGIDRLFLSPAPICTGVFRYEICPVFGKFSLLDVYYESVFASALCEAISHDLSVGSLTRFPLSQQW